MAMATRMHVHRTAAARTTPRVASLTGRPLVHAARRPLMAPFRRSVSRPGVVLVEANLFTRIVRIARAYLGNLTSSLEDPEVMLDRLTGEMEEDLIKMRQATAKVMGSEKQMSTKYAASQATADAWLRRAELAVRKGQDELAREALLRRKTYDQAAASLKLQLDAQRKALEQLQANMRMLESRLGEAKNKRETLKARAASAKSSKQVQEMVAGLRINNSTAWAAFDKMEEKVLSMEAEAESASMLAAPDSLEAKFEALAGSTVEDELAALKQGSLSAAAANRPALPAGRPVHEVLVGAGREREPSDVDVQLEALRKRARSQV